MELDAILRTQYGIITRAQAIECGLSHQQIDRRIRSGLFEVEHRGVFRLNAVAATWHSKLLAAVLATGGIASHRSATALWGLERFRNPPAEVTIPVSRSSSVRGVRLHQTTQWDRRAPTTRAGIVVTGVNRTILDAGAVASMRTVELLAESAIRQRMTTWPQLLECLRRHSRKGRDGCLDLRRVLEVRLRNRTIPLSQFSRLVSNLLVDGGLPEPVLECKIWDGEGNFIMQADLAWPDRKKAWELDGLEFHFGREDVERDRRKRNAAKAQGWNIQEILWSMYIEDPQGLVTMAATFLAT